METKPNTKNKSGSEVTKFICHHCGSTEGKLVATKSDIRFECYGHDKSVLKCKSCGLTQLYPQWTEKELEAMGIKTMSLGFKASKTKTGKRIWKTLKKRV